MTVPAAAVLLSLASSAHAEGSLQLADAVRLALARNERAKIA